MKKKMLFIPLTLLLAMSLVVIGCPAPAPPEVITVRVLHPWPTDFILHADLRMIMERGNERGEGRLIFQDIGGAEVYPTFEQIKALAAGSVDLLVTASAYAGDDFFEGVPLDWGMAGPTGEEVRKAGLIKDLDRMAREKLGVGVLAAPGYYYANVFLTKPITTLADLKKMKLRSVVTYDLLFKKLGVPTVVMPPGEIYTALETGVIDGLAFPTFGLKDFGFTELLKYQVYPDFWRGPGHLVYVNAAWFDALPGWAKDILRDVTEEVERDSVAVFKANMAAETRILRQMGIQPITISEAEWWDVQRIIYEETNNALRANSPPENAETIIKYMDKYYPPKEVWYPEYEWR